MARPKRTTQRKPAHHLLAWRTLNGLTQTQLGELIDRNHGQISKIETGISELGEDVAVALARALRISPGDLFFSPKDEVWTICRRLRQMTPNQRATALRLIDALDGNPGEERRGEEQN